jgi:ABC-type sugar transport system substrate-binding protein
MSKQRTDGFLSQAGDLIEVVQDVDAWDSDVSVNVAAEVMNAHPDLDLIFCANEGGTVGTVMAVKNAGKSIPVFGIDASEQLANMLLDGDNILQAVCGQDPIALGETSMTNLCLAMMGKEFGTAIKLPGVPLTRENPDEIREYVRTLKEMLGE